MLYCKDILGKYLFCQLDNEIGYSNKVLDLIRHMYKVDHAE